MVHCKQAMAGDCTAMLAKGLGLETDEDNKKLLCAKCHRGAFFAAKAYPWETLWLYPGDTASVLRQKILSTNELKQMAGYEIVISQKMLMRKPDSRAKAAWQIRHRQLEEIMPQAWQILLQQKPDLIISYNSLYGIHRLFCRLGEQLGIPNLCLHQSFNMEEDQEYVLFKSNIAEFLKELQEKTKRTVCSPSRFAKSKIKRHISGLFSGKKPWAYSEPLGLKNLSRNRRSAEAKWKILVTLSSPDELLGLELLKLLPKETKQPFRDQISWLRWIFSLAWKFPGVEFYIRPHPRLYPNKREAKVSEFSLHLEKVQKMRRPPNVVWPDQDAQGSIWNHLKDVDILFNAWSSVGDVFAYYGIPVFHFFPQFTNSGKTFGFSGMDKKQYEEKLRQILAGKIPRNTRMEVEKWLSVYLCTNTFHLAWRKKPWIAFVRRTIPKRLRETWDLALFSKYEIDAEQKKIENIVRKSTQCPQHEPCQNGKLR